MATTALAVARNDTSCDTESRGGGTNRRGASFVAEVSSRSCCIAVSADPKWFLEMHGNFGRGLSDFRAELFDGIVLEVLCLTLSVTMG